MNIENGVLIKSNPPLNKKIPCVVLIFFDFQIIKATINFLLSFIDRIELIVIENKSKYTDNLIKPFILNLIRDNKISKYLLFNKNITNNAVEVFFNTDILKLKNYEYIIITDGDLIVDNSDWLLEEIEILKKNSDVFICGVNLSLDNLPLKIFPSAIYWVPPPKKEHADYFEGLTGTHLLLLRTNDFSDFLYYRKNKKLKFVDGVLHNYCYKVLNKKWARTKKSVARHLTWDSFNDLDHPYTKMRTSKKFEEIWNHDSYCSFFIYYKNKNNNLCVRYYRSTFFKINKLLYFLKLNPKISKIFYNILNKHPYFKVKIKRKVKKLKKYYYFV